MDIAKVRELSDTGARGRPPQAKQDLWSARFALSTRQLKDYSTIPQTRRTIARILTVQRERELAPRRPEGAYAMTGPDTAGARQAQDEGRARRERQDGQDDRRVRRAADAPPPVQAGHPPDHEVQGPRRDQRGPHRRHRPDRGVPAAVGDEAVAARRGRPARRRARRPASRRRRGGRGPPRRSTRPPTRAATHDAEADADGRRGTQPGRPRRPPRDPGPDPPEGRRQHGRPDHPVHPRDGPLAEDRPPASAT